MTLLIGCGREDLIASCTLTHWPLSSRVSSPVGFWWEWCTWGRDSSGMLFLGSLLTKLHKQCNWSLLKPGRPGAMKEKPLWASLLILMASGHTAHQFALFFRPHPVCVCAGSPFCKVVIHTDFVVNLMTSLSLGNDPISSNLAVCMRCPQDTN